MGDVVWVPFPFVERPRLRLRPAPVVAVPGGTDGALVWTLMITSAANAGWRGDISLVVERFAECGLPSPSVIRTAKIASTDARSAHFPGRLPPDLWSEVVRAVRTNLGL